MNITLTEAQRELKETSRLFALRKIAPSAASRDEQRAWDSALFRHLGAGGLLGAPFPEAYGGQGRSAFEFMLLQEGVGEGASDAGFCLSWGAHTVLAGVPLWKMGTEAQKQHYLIPMCQGDKIGGLAASEAAAGSDPGSIQTRAVKWGSHWILNGTKNWITNAPIGDLFLVTARTGAGCSVFIVERDFPGVHFTPAASLLSLRTAQIGGLRFENCEVPAENLLGRVGGWSEISAVIDHWERTFLLASWLGQMKSTIDNCIAHVKQRIQFGRPLSHFQAVRAVIADMKIRCALARGFSYRAASNLDLGKSDGGRESLLAKLAVTEHAQSILRDALQLHGAHGLPAANALVRAFRDAAALTILKDNSQLLRSILAASLLDVG